MSKEPTIVRESAVTPINSTGVASRRAESKIEEAVENYVSGEGMWINQYLRGRGDFGGLSAEDKKYLSNLDKATSQELGKDQILYRSVDASVIFGNIDDLAYENLEGHLVYGDNQKIILQSAQRTISRATGIREEKGFMSTSRSEDVAREWGGFTGSDHPIVLKMYVPKGTKGYDASKFDIKGNEQREVLLQRGLRYKVGKVYGGKNGGIFVDVQVLKK